jgi:hypothetical protein
MKNKSKVMNWERRAMRCTAFVIGKGEIREFTFVKIRGKKGKAVGRGTSKKLEVGCFILIRSILRVLVRSIIRQLAT